MGESSKRTQPQERDRDGQLGPDEPSFTTKACSRITWSVKGTTSQPGCESGPKRRIDETRRRSAHPQAAASGDPARRLCARSR